MIRFILKHLIELCIFSGLLMLLVAALAGWYVHMREMQNITYSHTNLKSLVDALQLYSFENPDSKVFPPAIDNQDGIVLCPVRDNNLHGLSFLTTPSAYIKTIPPDPFMEQSMGKSFEAPAVLHWVKSNGDEPFTHVGWGAMSVGPALQLPPQYSIHVLREIPFSASKLNYNLFDTSNGLTSVGILYHDSLGNSNSL
jgi:hypothetical protein